MKKITVMLLVGLFTMTATTSFANCGKKDCKNCKKKETTTTACTKTCMKNEKCAEMKKKKA